MTSFRTIVVPLDGSITSEHALRPAHELARRTDATIRLLTVLPIKLWTTRVEDASRYLEKRAADEGLVRFEISVVTDEPAVDVIVGAASEDATFVCMSSHGHGGVMKTLLGSTAASVVRRSEHPILVVGPRCTPAFTGPEPGRLLIAVDDSAASSAFVASALHVARGLSLLPSVVHLPDNASPDAVLEHVRELPTTVVAVPTRAPSSDVLSSSDVAARILHESPCPVLMISDHEVG